MRVDRETREAHGAALLQAASRLFRGRGIEAVRVADISAAAGLTHGAFYGHFASKAALAEAACRQGLQQAAGRWRQRLASARAAGRDPVDDLIAAYLTEQHRDEPEHGCVLAALGPEIVRADAGLRRALAEGADGLADVLAEAIAARHPQQAEPADIAAAAAATLAALLGGMQLARAHGANPEKSRDALTAAAALARRAAVLPGKD